MSVQTEPNKPNRLIRIALPLLLVLSIGTFIAALLLPNPWNHRGNNIVPPAEQGFPVPAFSLTERSGETITKDDLLGKVWIASFIFTNCAGPCPKVTATMARLQKELDLADEPDLRLVTFSIDPKRDTPKVLREYAKHFQAHPQRWLFLTGDEKTIHNLSVNGFKLLSKRSPQPNPPFGQEFDHSTKLCVVDKNGVIRDQFDGIQVDTDIDGSRYQESLNKLKATVRELLAE